LINDTLAKLPSQDVRMQVETLDEVVEIYGNKISKPIEFKLEADSPAKVEKWQLSIMDSGGRIIRILEGDGPPPESVIWDGMTNRKRLVKGGGIYQYQMVFHYSDGSRATSARKLFGVNQTTAISVTLTGSAFEVGSAELTPQAKQISKEIADLLRKYSQEKVIIEGHTDSIGSESYNLKLSKMRAEATAAYLVEEEKIPAERILVKWWGESKPLGSNDIEEGRALNRRIEIKGRTYQIDRSKILDQYRMQPSVKIDDTPVKVDAHGRFSAALPGDKFKEFSIEVINKQGQSSSATFSVPFIEIFKPEKNLLLPYGVSGPGYRVNDRTEILEGSGQTTVLYYDLLGRTEVGNTVEIDGDQVDVETNGVFEAPLALKQGVNPYGILVRNPAGISRIMNVLITVSDKDEKGHLIIVVEPVPNLTVNLPPKGVALTNQLLTLSGQTDVGNRVVINSEPVAVDGGGHFTTAVTLPVGQSTLEIAAIDSQGRVGVIRRDVEVKATHFFFLAFADAKISKIKLKDAGVKDDTDYYTEGRVAFYLKGVVKGKYLVTAAMDTGRGEFDQLFKDLDKPVNDKLLTNLDPDKFYPVYGDSSTIVYDTQSQGKLYLAIDSDEFHLLVGNYQLNISDTELAGYQRTLFGAKVAYESVSKTKYGQPDTKVTVFGAEVFQVPVVDELTATGGSLYYLSHREVIEGSEQVTVVVRDKNTGLQLASLPQQQNIDYDINYDQGRLLFKRPISSHVADDTIIDPDLLSGSQVFIRVNYEAVEDSFEATAVGGRVRQQIGDHVAVGGTYVNDELSASEYELSAVDTEVRVGQNTRVVAEYAQSSGSDSRVFVSVDGGLSFSESTPNGTEEGRAFKLAAEVDVGEWFGQADRFQIGGYFKRLEQGFISNGNFLEQGTDKSGVHLSVKLGDHDSFKARFDQIKTEAGASQPETETDTAILQWHHDRGWWSLTAEYQGRRFLDFTNSSDDYANFMAARLQVKPIEDLTVSFEHQHTLSGEENDQSSAGVQYQLFDKLALDASGTTGTRGQSAQGGLILSLDDGQRVYVNQRLADEAGGRTSATVLGAEAPVGQSARIYSEYQWQHSPGDDRNVSLFGARRQWEAVKGLDVFLSGELSSIDADSQDTTRYSVAGGVSYATADGFKASSRQEIRRETGDLDRFQYLTSNTVELKLSPDFTALGKLRYSHTDDLDRDQTEAFFRQYTVGLAYRPVEYDRFNALAKYTRLAEQGPEDQIDGEPFVSDTDVAAIEWSFDLTRRLEWVQKSAYKTKTETVGTMPENTTHTFLNINRLNVNFYKNFDLGLEYRLLHQEEAQDTRQGWLTELMWKPVKHFRIGVGWNFTDFSDNEFSDNDYSQQGWFLRFQGTF
jgi:outer membrane protein OmpA-like peptidoglycan-associated protein